MGIATLIETPLVADEAALAPPPPEHALVTRARHDTAASPAAPLTDCRLESMGTPLIWKMTRITRAEWSVLNRHPRPHERTEGDGAADDESLNLIIASDHYAQKTNT
jgi:hypothetical protein